MAENYSFFNSKDHDRIYNARHWADYFFPLFTPGVFNGSLQVVADEGMAVKIKPGYAWIDGYSYHLTDGLVINLGTASGNMNRADSIVIRLDLTNRFIRAFCKTGSYYAGTAVPPAPEITATIHEIVIAHISVRAGVTEITQDMITDTRMDKEVCGWVCGAVEQIDFSQATAQFAEFFSQYKKSILTQYNAYLTNITGKENDAAEKLQSMKGSTDELYQQYRTYTLNAYNAYLETIQTDETEAAVKLDALKTALDNAYSQYVNDTSAAAAGFLSYLTGKEGAADTAYQDMVATFAAYMTAQQTSFETWFNNIKGQLSTDAAGHLQNEVDGIKNKQDETDESAANLKAVFEKYVLQNRAIINSLSYNQLAVIMELEILKSAEITGTNDNVVIEVFDAAVTPKKGYYDDVNRKVYA